ncbi:hypothetical protein MHH33_00125 [Paenisporosarcina sp. FSL H8-0542]|uniref:hypothetical protein n=1 Tax=Paenisporosarcina sp. FSL H8-0542 TaxID=2921401 RepID=UPI00315A9C85
MNTKLILVEGLPGFGKSTTAKLMHELLKEHDIENELFSEGNLNHPADYDGVAYYTNEEFEKLLSANTEYATILKENAKQQENGTFISYQKMKNTNHSSLSDDVYTLLSKNDIYELPLDIHIPLMINNWKEFVQHALKSHKTYIFECCLIQNPITISMIKYNASSGIVSDYILQLAKIIEPLNPLLIYVDQENLHASFEKAYKERDNNWAEGFIDYYTNQGYGKANDYTGVEGTLKVLEARKLLENEIVDQIDFMTVRVNNSSYNFTQYKTMLEVIVKEKVI